MTHFGSCCAVVARGHNGKALDDLKFSIALPHRLAVATLAARLADLPAARTVLAEPVRTAYLS